MNNLDLKNLLSTNTLPLFEGEEGFNMDDDYYKQFQDILGLDCSNLDSLFECKPSDLIIENPLQTHSSPKQHPEKYVC